MAPQPDTLRIASLNLWGRFGAWRERLVALQHDWPRIRADVLCVQEACLDAAGDQVAELAEALGLGYRAAFYPRGYAEGIAVLSAHPLREKEADLLPNSGFPRAMIRVRVAEPFELTVIATHLSYRPADDNRAQMGTVLGAARSAGDPVVLGGDFNIPTDAVEAAAPDFTHALGSISATWPVVELAELERAWRERTGAGLPADFDATPRRLDHLLARGLDVRVAAKTTIAGFDHALVWADLRPEGE